MNWFVKVFVKVWLVKVFYVGICCFGLMGALFGTNVQTLILGYGLLSTGLFCLWLLRNRDRDGLRNDDENQDAAHIGAERKDRG